MRRILLCFAWAVLLCLGVSGPCFGSPASLNLNIAFQTTLGSPCELIGGSDFCVHFSPGPVVATSNTFTLSGGTPGVCSVPLISCVEDTYGPGGSVTILINGVDTYDGTFTSAISDSVSGGSGQDMYQFSGTFVLNGFSGTGVINSLVEFHVGVDSAGLSYVGTPTPEPASLLLLGTGLLGLGPLLRRKWHGAGGPGSP